MPDPTPLRSGLAAPWPAPPDDAVLHGVAGAIVSTVLPHTEADQAALLLTLLACAGNAIGTRPHYRVNGARHELRIYPVLVGATSSGRKGTAVDALSPIFSAALPEWWARRASGLVSGEGLIYRVRDARTARGPRRERGVLLDPAGTVVLDEGEPEKRLLIIEKEFGGLLRVMTREGNTLSSVLRDAWDGGPMETMAKHEPARTAGAHITLLGHVTPEELTELLTSTEAHNGFANRFLWVCVRRSKELPFGGDLADDAILAMGDVLRAAIEDAATLGRLTLSEAARELWRRVYGPLTAGEPGLVGVLLGRGAPYVLRLAGTYAALDGSAEIDVPHLRAGLALWSYCDASVRHVFGVAPSAAQNPYRGMILAGLAGGSLTQSEIANDLFGGNLRQPEPHATLDALLAEGLVERTFERPASGRGRNIIRWSLTTKGREGRSG